MMYLLTSMILSLSMFTLMMNTPISLGITILMLALMIAIFFSSMISPWMAFLIFLIYISGTLIMFAYFIAMAPNKTMFFPFQVPMMMSTPPTMFILCKTMIYNPSLNTFHMQTNTFYNNQNMNSLIILAIILLITMIIVVKIAASTKGPLRPFNYV